MNWAVSKSCGDKNSGAAADRCSGDGGVAGSGLWNKTAVACLAAPETEPSAAEPDFCGNAGGDRVPG